MKKLTTIKSCLILLSCVLSIYSHGYSRMTGNPYYVQCYTSINGTSFQGGAKDDMDNLKTTVNEDMQAPIMQQNIDNTSAKIALYNSLFANMIKNMNDNYAIKAEEESRMEKESFKKEMDYIKHLSEESMNEELYGFFDDKNGKDGNVKKGTQSYKYFKELCKRNKMFEKISGAKQRASRNNKVHSALRQTTKKMTSLTNSVQLSNELIEEHYSKYCNAYDIQAQICSNPNLVLCEANNVEGGVCDASDGRKPYKLSNAEINSVNFLNPLGDDETNTIPEELFKTKYTYDEKESKAADMFAQNLVYSNFLPAPSLKEKTESRKSEFIAEYSSNIAMLNLANNSFMVAKKQREPITGEEEGEVKMSEIDVLRYILHNFKGPDNNAAVLAAKEKGVDVVKYSLMTVRNKLMLNKYEQNERIETLLAAMLVYLSNSPDNVEYLNELK